MRKLFVLFVVFGSLLTIVLFGIFLFAIMHQRSAAPGSVLHVVLSGPIAEGEQPPLAELMGDGSGASFLQTVTGLERAGRDPSVLGVVFDIRDPELGLSQVLELEAALATLRSAGKWSIAYLETAGELGRGNGAYALAAMADEIIISPPGDVGLTGLRAEPPFLKNMLAKLEIDATVSQRHGYKNAGNMFNQDKFTAQHKEATVALLEDLEAELVGHIARRRKIDESQARRWLNEGPYSAEKAKELGIVDGLAYWDGVLDRVQEKLPAENKGGKVSERLVRLGEYLAMAPRESSSKTLAYIVGEGDIHRGPSEDSPFERSSSIGSDTLAKAFRDARQDEVDGILFRVDSPGGSYIASDIIRREVELCRKAGIPVVVSMGQVAASGGYFVSMGADKVLASPATITGSIGVLAIQFHMRRFFGQLLGITFDGVETAPNARLFSSLDPLPAAEQQKLETALDEIYDDFVGKAAAARQKSVEELHAVAQGRVWSGKRALEKGLIDELGGVTVALTRLREIVGDPVESDADLVSYPRPKGFLESMAELGNEVSIAVRLPVELRRLVASLRSAAGPLSAAPVVPELDL